MDFPECLPDGALSFFIGLNSPKYQNDHTKYLLTSGWMGHWHFRRYTSGGFAALTAGGMTLTIDARRAPFDGVPPPDVHAYWRWEEGIWKRSN